ncbi:hypothetical protein ACET3Z_018488 [Daucus carota]
MENIHVPERSVRNYEASEYENQEWMEDFRVPERSVKSYRVVQASEDENQQGIEHIRQGSRSVFMYNGEAEADEYENQHWMEDIQGSTRNYRGVQANKDENQLGIEHIREAARSIVNYRVVRADQDKDPRGFENIRDRNQQGVEHIRDRMLFFLMYNEDEQEIEHVKNTMSISFELLDLVRNEHLSVEEQPTLRPQVLNMIKFLHDKGLDSAKCEVKRDLEKLNQSHHESPTTVEYVKNYLELMLRMFDSETFQRRICKIMSEAERDQVPCKHCKVVRANEGENRQGIEHIRSSTRSVAMYYGGVQADEDEEDNQGIEHIREAARSIVNYGVVQANEDEEDHQVVRVSEDVNKQWVEHIRVRMLSFLMYDGGPQANEDENRQEIEHVENTLLISFDLLKLVEYENLPVEEQPTLRPEVLRVIKFLHDRGLEYAQCEVKRDLEKLKTTHSTITKTVQYVKMYLELMLQMFESVTFQRTICKMMSKAEGDQALCKHCKVVQANEGEN